MVPLKVKFFRHSETTVCVCVFSFLVIDICVKWIFTMLLKLPLGKMTGYQILIFFYFLEG